jgi:PilZ domain-containing protein
MEREVYPMPSERRRFSRIVFHRPAELDVRVARVTCEVTDVSFRGALVEVPRSLRTQAGAKCTLTIRLDAGDAVIRMEGEIAHREGTLVGVRCLEIDLDSMSHLRRLVELNVGDEAILHRELSALVGGK